MECKIYHNDVFRINIYYTDDNSTIIINIINQKNLVYENIINDKNIDKICIFNVEINNIQDYYNFIINSFENYEKYEIVFLNTNTKFIRITIKEKIYGETAIIKNILWIKNKKDYNNEDDEYFIDLKINNKLLLYNIDNKEIIENNENFIIIFFKNIYKNISELFN